MEREAFPLRCLESGELGDSPERERRQASVGALFLQQDIFEETSPRAVLRLSEPEIACLRTSGCGSRGHVDQPRTPSSFGSWLSAKTAFFLTRCPDRSQCAADHADRFPCPPLREPEQRLTANFRALVVACGRDSVSTTAGTLPDDSRGDLLAHLVARILREHAAEDRAPASPRALPSQKAVSPRSHSGRVVATKPSSVRSAAGTLCSAWPHRRLRDAFRWSPVSTAAVTARRATRRFVRLPVAQPDQRHAGRVDVAIRREGADAADATVPTAGEDVEFGRGSSAIRVPRRSKPSPVFMTPLPFSSGTCRRTCSYRNGVEAAHLPGSAIIGIAVADPGTPVARRRPALRSRPWRRRAQLVFASRIPLARRPAPPPEAPHQKPGRVNVTGER